MNDIPINIIATEERADGIHVTGELPSDFNHQYGVNDLSIKGEAVPPMTRDEMNDLLESEGLDIRVRTEPKTQIINEMQEVSAKSEEFLEKEAKQAQIYAGLNSTTHGMFKSYFKQETVTNPNKDRSLSGKARRKARRGN